MKARSLVKFMDVCAVKVTDEDGFLAGSMMINAKNTIMKERIWIDRVASEIVFLLWHPGSGALLHEECVIASNSTSKVSLMECGHPGNLLLTCLEEFPEKVVTVPKKKIENTVQAVIGFIGFCFHFKCHRRR